MAGIGSTNAMKKGSGNNPFLAFTEADMRSFLNSSYVGCIVKYTGDAIQREITDANRTTPEHAQNIVFKNYAFPDLALRDGASINIFEKDSEGTVTESYIVNGAIKNGVFYYDKSSLTTPYVDVIAWVDAKANNANVKAVLYDSAYGWHHDTVNDQKMITLWSYSDDVTFTVTGDDLSVFELLMYVEPYKVGELYKVVYGDGEYYFEEYYYISEYKTTGNSDYIAPGKTMYDFTGELQVGNGSKVNPYIASTADEMAIYLTSTYLNSFVKYTGETTEDYVKNAIYQVAEDGDTTMYMVLPSLDNEGSASDLAAGKQLINSQGEVVEGEYDTGLGIVEFLTKTYSGSINDKNGDVTVLYGGQFLSQSRIAEVNLPNVSVIGSSLNYGVNSIYGRGYTFYGCNLLSKINFSNICSIVGTNNFAYCYSLKYANFSGVNTIPESTFFNCRALEIIDAQDATYIGGSAFANCFNIKQANFGAISYVGFYGFASAFSIDNDVSLSFASNSAITFSQNAMASCKIKRLYINTTSNVVLSGYAFFRCTSLSDVNITASNLTLYTEGNTFYGCANLTNVLLNTSGTFGLGNYMFAYCTNLKWGNLSSAKIKTLYHSVFYQCSNLDYAYLPYLELLSGQSIFYSCKSLSYVYMPILKSISRAGVFNYCTNLRSVYIMQESGLTDVPVLATSNIFYSTNNNLKIYVGYDEYVSMLQSANNWSYYSSRIMASQFDSSVLLE